MAKQTQSLIKGTSAAVRRILALAGSPSDIRTAIMLVVERLMGNVLTPPTDLEGLAHRLNVSGFESEDMPLSGELRRVGSEFRVYYSSYLTALQRRFTIAHELGHAVFALTGRNYPRSGEEVERICDMFAAEFLMPTREFRNRLGVEPTAERILELSKLFKAPLFSTAIRAAEFKDLSVFTLEDQVVTWTFGIIPKGTVYKRSLYLKSALESVSKNSSGDITFAMSGDIFPTQARLTWTLIANGNRALCVLRKMRLSRQAGQSYDALADGKSA